MSLSKIPLVSQRFRRRTFIGSYVLGLGFVLEPEEARALIDKDSRNADVVFPYLNGEDLNDTPDQSPTRWVINFFDWDQAQAMGYPDCYAIVEASVKPERTRLKPNGEFALRQPLPQRWWQYADKRPALYRSIASLKRVLVVARVTKYVSLTFLSKDIVFNEKTVVIPFDTFGIFSVLQSDIHHVWAWQYSSTLGSGTLNYAPSDCVETFPFPPTSAYVLLEGIGETYHETRRQIMLNRQEGLTATYNRFHNPDEHSDDIQHLRDLHRQMDEAVAAAYGWEDMALEHDFHETAQGVRYTISEAARREVLKRLLALNFERYEEEQRLGLHEKTTKKGGKRKRKNNSSAENVPDSEDQVSAEDDDPNAQSPEQLSLFDDDDPKQQRLL